MDANVGFTLANELLNLFNNECVLLARVYVLWGISAFAI